MRDTTVTVLRGGNNPQTNILVGTDGRNATGIFVQVDQASDKEQFQYMQIYQFNGYNFFKVKTQFWYANSLIAQNDVLVDERYNDVVKGKPYFYRVVGLPKDYQYDHQELVCWVTVGN